MGGGCTREKLLIPDYSWRAGKIYEGRDEVKMFQAESRWIRPKATLWKRHQFLLQLKSIQKFSVEALFGAIDLDFALQLFNEWDRDHTGRASMPDLERELEMNVSQYPPTALLFKAMDVDGDGWIDFRDFLITIENFRNIANGASDNLGRYCFHIINTKKMGLLSLDEFVNFVIMMYQMDARVVRSGKLAYRAKHEVLRMAGEERNLAFPMTDEAFLAIHKTNYKLFFRLHEMIKSVITYFRKNLMVSDNAPRKPKFGIVNLKKAWSHARSCPPVIMDAIKDEDKRKQRRGSLSTTTSSEENDAEEDDEEDEDEGLDAIDEDSNEESSDDADDDDEDDPSAKKNKPEETIVHFNGTVGGTIDGKYVVSPLLAGGCSPRHRQFKHEQHEILRPLLQVILKK